MSSNGSQGNDNQFRWIVGGLLSCIAILIGLTWAGLKNEIADLRADVRSLQVAVSSSSADIKLITTQLIDAKEALARAEAKMDKSK
jgi:outer membrane murein-binding lipoprotein Lpp